MNDVADEKAGLAPMSSTKKELGRSKILNRVDSNYQRVNVLVPPLPL
jgi:hypothetical protein